MKRARILIGDDHAVTLEGIRTILGQRHQILGAVTDGRALVEAALPLKPQLVVADITMPFLSGIDAATQIRRNILDVKFIFITMHANPVYLEAALAAGASGYVLKSSAREELLKAVGEVLQGRVYVSASLVSGAVGLFPTPSLAAAAVPRLSPRECATLQLIAEGRSSKEIAGLMNISVKTVTFHRENVKTKLGVRTTAELTRKALELGLI